MNHENDLLDRRERGQCGHARSLPAHGSVSRRDPDAAAHRAQPTRDGGDRAPFATGGTFMAHADGENIQLTKVTRDFIHWINPTTGSTGRMLRCHFLNFFTPFPNE